MVSGCPVVTTDYPYFTEDAFNGGGCLLFTGSFEDGERTNEIMFRFGLYLLFVLTGQYQRISVREKLVQRIENFLVKIMYFEICEVVKIKTDEK